MADNYPEYRREDYERKKAEWLKKKRHRPLGALEKPEDEAL